MFQALALGVPRLNSDYAILGLRQDLPKVDATLPRHRQLLQLQRPLFVAA
jgi:hypothetical protein